MMDRKAFRNCGAVLASLGAILSAGCGAKSVGPSTGSPSASLGAATRNEQTAVIVSHAETSDASHEAPEPWTAEDEPVQVVGKPIEVVASRPEPRPVAIMPAAAVEEIPDAEQTKPIGADEPVEADRQYAVDSATVYPQAQAARATAPTDGSAAATPSGVANGKKTEIRFALPSTAGSAQGLEPNRSESPTAREARRGGGLTPVMITPREILHSDQAPQEQDIERPDLGARAVDQEPVVAESKPADVPPSVTAPATPLPRLQPTRSPAMTAAVARVHERVRHAINLAEKGALYAARKEFTTAVKMIAQAQDVEQVTRQHTRAAVAGFVALKEANDFVRQNAQLGVLDVAALVSGHKTPVLKDEDASDVPPTVAAGYYFDFAKHRLAEAVGRETLGSIALYGLGKLVVAGAGTNLQQLEYSGPAMALFQASLIAEPENYRAAHELGVLLAGSGQLEQARDMLASSADRAPQAIIWRNLAAVHARLGERQLADQAQRNATVLEQTNPKSNAPPVEWVDPATFARTVSVSDPAPPPLPSTATHPTAKSTQPPSQAKASVAKKRPDRWNPLNLRR